MKYLLSFFTLIVVALPFSVNAETVLRISDTLSLESDQTVNGDFYGATGLRGPISISGTIKGDALLAGSSITSNGEIEEDLFAIGASVQLHAPVNDDVRIVAGEVTLADYVGGDVFVIGGMLKVLSTAEIAGNVFFYGGEAEINGVVGGSIFGTSQTLRIDGPVGGSVDVTAAKALTIGGRADIAGNINYSSSKELIRAQDAVVVGEITSRSLNDKKSSAGNSERWMSLLSLTFLTLTLFVLLRSHLPSLINGVLKSATKNGLFGLMGLLLTPILIGLLIITLVGSLLGAMFLFAFFFLLLFSFALVPILLGKLINRHIFKAEGLTLLSTLLGIVLMQVLMFVPVLGPVIIFALLTIILGSLLYRVYRSLV